MANDDDASETLGVEMAQADAKALEQSMTSQKKKKAVSESENLAFISFWKAYPRKISKQQALRAWNKLKPSQALTDVIMRALEMQKKSDQWQRDNGAFIPHASTWLNQQRWEDELEPARPQRQQRQQRSQAPSNRFVNSTGVRDFSDLVEW